MPAPRQLEILVNARDNASPAFKSAGSSANSLAAGIGGSFSQAALGILKAELALRAIHGSILIGSSIWKALRGDMEGATDTYLEGFKILETIPVVGQALRMTGLREALEGQQAYFKAQQQSIKDHAAAMKKHVAELQSIRMQTMLAGMTGIERSHFDAAVDIRKQLEALRQEWLSLNEATNKEDSGISQSQYDSLTQGIRDRAKALHELYAAQRQTIDKPGNDRRDQIAAALSIDPAARRKADSLYEQRVGRIAGMNDAQDAEEATAAGNTFDANSLRIQMGTQAQIQAVNRQKDAAIRSLYEDQERYGWDDQEVEGSKRQYEEGARKEIDAIIAIRERKWKAMVAGEKKVVAASIAESQEFELRQRLKAAEEASDKVMVQKLKEKLRILDVSKEFNAEIEKLTAAMANPATSQAQRDVMGTRVAELRRMREYRMEHTPKEKAEKAERERPDLNFQYSTRLTGLREASKESPISASIEKQLTGLREAGKESQISASIEKQLTVSTDILKELQRLQEITRDVWSKIRMVNFAG